MQGIYGRDYSELCLGLNNAADEFLRLAQRVKINEIKRIISTQNSYAALLEHGIDHLNGVLYIDYV